MFCNRCGQSIESTDAFCGRCGAANPLSGTAGADSTQKSSEESSREQAYTRQDYAPGKSGRSTSGPVHTSGNQPGVTGSIIFSVINIVAFGFGISMVLGIIALVITLNANNQLTGDALAAKLRTARTLNIIAIAIVLVQIVVIVSAIVFTVLGTVMWGIWG